MPHKITFNTSISTAVAALVQRQQDLDTQADELVRKFRRYNGAAILENKALTVFATQWALRAVQGDGYFNAWWDNDQAHDIDWHTDAVLIAVAEHARAGELSAYWRTLREAHCHNARVANHIDSVLLPQVRLEMASTRRQMQELVPPDSADDMREIIILPWQW